MVDSLSSSSPKPSRLGKWLDYLLWGAGIAILVIALWPKDSGPSVGAPASSFELPLVGAQGSFSHEGPRDKPLLVEAFASWCGACRRSNGLISSLGEANEQLDVVAVSVDDNPAAALNAKRSWPIDVPVLHDRDGSFQRNYRVQVLPTFILIGKGGEIQDVTVGRVGATDLRRWLRAAD